jgi:hypothetical protein
VATTDATVTDTEMTEPVHHGLAARELLPGEHVVDAGHVTAAHIVTARDEHRIDLVGPVGLDTHHEQHGPGHLDQSAFAVDWQARTVTCPRGAVSVSWSDQRKPSGTAITRVHFALRDCDPCPPRTQCTKAANGRYGRSLTLLPQAQQQVLDQRRREQQTDEWKKRYDIRAGVEGTISQVVRRTGIRRTRCNGLAKTHLGHVLAATAISSASTPGSPTHHSARPEPHTSRHSTWQLEQPRLRIPQRSRPRRPVHRPRAAVVHGVRPPAARAGGVGPDHDPVAAHRVDHQPGHGRPSDRQRGAGRRRTVLRERRPGAQRLRLRSPERQPASRSDLWRLVLPQRAGWFAQITIAANSLNVVVEGDAQEDAELELSTATGNQGQPAAEPGVYRFELPHGLEHDSLLILRRKDQWLDLRTFPAPAFGRARDASVVWEQPGPDLEILLAAGEGQHLECKREAPKDEARKKMLKTIAAFASQDGGTVLIGVEDDLQITGLPDAGNVDKQTLQVVNMIRDTIEPVPPYTTRVIDHDGRKVLAVEVSGGGQMHAYRNGARLEFYVRVGPNTVPARHHEVAAGFRQA